MKKLILACSIMLLLLLIKNDQVFAQPDPLDVCHDSVDRIETLLSRFPKLVVPDNEHYPLLDVLVCEDMDSSRRYQITEVLLKHGANPNSPRHALAECGDSALAELLIKFGARVNETDVLGNALWGIDVRHNDDFCKSLGLIRALFRHGADPMAVEDAGGGESVLYNLGESALYDFIDRVRGDDGEIESDYDEADYSEPIPACALDIAKVLVDAGANVNIGRKITIDPPIQDALDAKGRLRVKYIEQNDGDNTPLSAAVHARWPAAVDYLISKGANVNFRDRNGDPILYHALNNRQQDDGEDTSKIEADDSIISILRSHGAKEK